MREYIVVVVVVYTWHATVRRVVVVLAGNARAAASGGSGAEDGCAGGVGGVCSPAEGIHVHADGRSGANYSTESKFMYTPMVDQVRITLPKVPTYYYLKGSK